jgi:hypothetical protein
MFNFKTKVLMMASFLVLGGVAAANAQVSDSTALKFDVSHSFMVKDTTLPAGRYTITRTPSLTDSKSLLIIQGDNRESVIFDTMTTERGKAADTQLVFNEVDGNYFLSAIWMRGETVGNALPQTEYERKLTAEHRAKSEGAMTQGSDQ